MSSLAEVACSRTYSAPPGRVFRAFIDPQLIPLWWSPDPEVSVTVVEWTPVPGGRWRFAYGFPDGSVIHVRGVFREVEADHRLVFTWTWEPPDMYAGIETMVSVTIEAAGDGAVVHVRHERFPDESTRSRHDAGWNSTLDRLDEVLS